MAIHGGQGVTWLLDGPVKSERREREGDRISSPGSKLVVVSRAARRNERLNEREIGGDGDGSNFVRGGGGGGGGGSGWEKYSLLVKVDAGKQGGGGGGGGGGG